MSYFEKGHEDTTPTNLETYTRQLFRFPEVSARMKIGRCGYCGEVKDCGRSQVLCKKCVDNFNTVQASRVSFIPTLTSLMIETLPIDKE